MRRLKIILWFQNTRGLFLCRLDIILALSRKVSQRDVSEHLEGIVLVPSTGHHTTCRYWHSSQPLLVGLVSILEAASRLWGEVGNPVMAGVIPSSGV